jgi:hypothetical protein
VKGVLTYIFHRYAKFCYDAWRNPKTLEAISQVVGVDLTLVMDYEVSHVNVHLKDDGKDDQDSKPIVEWHKDSYPFVCVVMLSKTSSMVGGILELKGRNGDIIKIPQMEQVGRYKFRGS